MEQTSNESIGGDGDGHENPSMTMEQTSNESIGGDGDDHENPSMTETVAESSGVAKINKMVGCLVDLSRDLQQKEKKIYKLEAEIARLQMELEKHRKIRREMTDFFVKLNIEYR